jgi:hypothetical membrane protein
VSDQAHSKNATFGAIVMLLIISGLTVWGIGLMNDGAYLAAAAAGLLLFLFGAFAVLVLGRE